VGVNHILDKLGHQKNICDWKTRVFTAIFFTQLTEQDTLSPDPEHKQYDNQMERILRYFMPKSGPAFHLTKAVAFTLHECFHFNVYLIWRPDLLLDGKCKIYCFDSMKGNHNTHFRILTHLVKNLYIHSDPQANVGNVAQEASKLECVTVDVTQQKNLYDCGVHCVLNFEILLAKVKTALVDTNR
jgi:Ulp1 family protease